MIHNGVTTGTPAKIAFGAGVYFQGVTFDPLIAPTEEAVKKAVIGATQEGGTFTITPEFFTPELDGVNVAVKELQQKVGETAQMEVSFAELTSDLAAKMAIGKVTESTDKDYDVLTSSEHLTAGHYYNGFGYYGRFLDGRPLIIIFKNALCTSGFQMNNQSKTNTVMKGTFDFRGNIAYSTAKLPFVIFIRKTDGWETVTPAEAAAAAQS